MKMIAMNAQILQYEGKPTHVIMPYDDFVAWNEQIEDDIDVKLIRLSQAKNAGKPRHSLDEVRAKLGLKA